MNLNPKGDFFELEVLNGHIRFITLHYHQMFFEAPWLALHNSINIFFVIKREKDFVVPDPLCFETSMCSPQRGKSFSKNINVRARFVMNLATMEKTLELSSLVRQQPGPSLSNRVRQVHNWVRCSIFCFPKPLKKKPNNLRNKLVIPRRQTNTFNQKGHLILLFWGG